MALELKEAVSQKADGTEFYIEVVNATGVYNVSTNPGGFGAPNPARNTLALIFYGNHKKVAGDVLAVPVTYDPLVVSQFTILLDEAKNGHIQYYITALQIFSLIGVYADGDIVYNNQNPLLPVIQKRIAGVFTTITAAQMIGEAGVVDELASNQFPIPDAINFKNQLLAEKFPILQDFINERTECLGDEYEESENNFTYVDNLLELATLDFAAQAYNQAEIKLEEVFEFKDKIEA